MSIPATAGAIQREAPRRFHLLDPLRGVAALAVVLYHCVGTHPHVSDGLLGRVLLQGWAGVFIFFPISGYCIAAATQGSHWHGLRSFVARRWRRIYPPYLASIIFAIAVGFAALPFSRGSASSFYLPAAGWASILTLTQVFTQFDGRINPVYWSLCYEEQFYIVMALSLMFTGARARAAYLVAVTVAAIALNLSGWTVPGLFTGFWVPFAAGIGVYYSVGEQMDRRIGALLLALCVISAAVLPTTGTFVSLFGALVMLALAPFDGWFARHASRAWLRPLFVLGLVSYSLYLIHVPVGGRVLNLLTRVDAPVWLCAIAGAVSSVLCARLFFKWIERPFLNPRPSALQAAQDRRPLVIAAAS